jgi:glycosyltransferase involved in cell wall biosynthesis
VGFWIWWMNISYLIDVHDKPAFSQTLRELISDPQLLLRLRKASLEKSRDFDIQKVADRYQAIMQEVLKGN